MATQTKNPQNTSHGSNETVIDLNDIQLTLGEGASEVHVLKGITTKIAKGEPVGIVGPSGSGKSTLLMVMAGLERIDDGTITIDGTALENLPPDPEHDSA